MLGCGLWARAACELRDQAGIDATTIASLRQGLDQAVALAHGAVLLIDEAGMVGTRDLAALADAAKHSQAKLVLVGDNCQLPEIQAGGAFRALAQRLGAVELHEVHRQRDSWDRDALAALRRGELDTFARMLEASRAKNLASDDIERSLTAELDQTRQQLGQIESRLAFYAATRGDALVSTRSACQRRAPHRRVPRRETPPAVRGRASRSAARAAIGCPAAGGAARPRSARSARVQPRTDRMPRRDIGREL